ncbi:zinc-binding dehydrogenase [Xylariaceae sp. FL0594]|nr:zinc-binding dehydrogenase [Xylariaceae sp. FL0594]
MSCFKLKRSKKNNREKDQSKMTAIRKVLIPEFGDVDVLQVVDDVCEPPPAGHVQIATEYSGFAGGDINMRKGIYPFMKKAPLTPGYCLVGKVVATGEGADKFRPGDVVAVLTKYDAEATLVNQPEKYCVAVPDGVDHQQATALLLDWNTGYSMAVHTAKVAKGQRVFVHGLSGAVGYALMTVCMMQGAEVYGTASESKHAELRARGAHPFVYTNKDWIKAMQDMGGADAVFDPLGYDSYDESFSILSKTGILVAYGTNKQSLNGEEAGNPTPSVLKMLVRGLNPLSSKSTTFFGVSRDNAHYHENITTLLDMLKNGKIQVPIKKVWPMEDIQAAHREWGTGSGIGSFLIKVAKD